MEQIRFHKIGVFQKYSVSIILSRNRNKNVNINLAATKRKKAQLLCCILPTHKSKSYQCHFKANLTWPFSDSTTWSVCRRVAIVFVAAVKSTSETCSGISPL